MKTRRRETVSYYKRRPLSRSAPEGSIPNDNVGNTVNSVVCRHPVPRIGSGILRAATGSSSLSRDYRSGRRRHSKCEGNSSVKNRQFHPRRRTSSDVGNSRQTFRPDSHPLQDSNNVLNTTVIQYTLFEDLRQLNMADLLQFLSAHPDATRELATEVPSLLHLLELAESNTSNDVQDSQQLYLLDNAWRGVSNLMQRGRLPPLSYSKTTPSRHSPTESISRSSKRYWASLKPISAEKEKRRDVSFNYRSQRSRTPPIHSDGHLWRGAGSMMPHRFDTLKNSPHYQDKQTKLYAGDLCTDKGQGDNFNCLFKLESASLRMSECKNKSAMLFCAAKKTMEYVNILQKRLINNSLNQSTFFTTIVNTSKWLYHLMELNNTSIIEQEHRNKINNSWSIILDKSQNQTLVLKPLSPSSLPLIIQFITKLEEAQLNSSHQFSFSKELSSRFTIPTTFPFITYSLQALSNTIFDGNDVSPFLPFPCHLCGHRFPTSQDKLKHLVEHIQITKAFQLQSLKRALYPSQVCKNLLTDNNKDIQPVNILSCLPQVSISLLKRRKQISHTAQLLEPLTDKDENCEHSVLGFENFYNSSLFITSPQVLHHLKGMWYQEIQSLQDCLSFNHLLDNDIHQSIHYDDTLLTQHQVFSQHLKNLCHPIGFWHYKHSSHYPLDPNSVTPFENESARDGCYACLEPLGLIVDYDELYFSDSNLTLQDTVSSQSINLTRNQKLLSDPSYHLRQQLHHPVKIIDCPTGPSFGTSLLPSLIRSAIINKSKYYQPSVSQQDFNNESLRHRAFYKRFPPHLHITHTGCHNLYHKTLYPTLSTQSTNNTFETIVATDTTLPKHIPRRRRF